jgi:hypothetical protein
MQHFMPENDGTAGNTGARKPHPSALFKERRAEVWRMRGQEIRSPEELTRMVQVSPNTIRQS